ncbi:MAG TPA: anti-sigma regulatory factor [Micromonosporaceae bacterium]
MAGSGQEATEPLAALDAVVSDGWEPPPVGSAVEVSVPALAEFLDVVRTATAGLAARLSLSLDDIEDLRSIVNDACTLVLSLPRPAQVPALTCRYEILPDALAIRVATTVNDGAQLPARQSFTWRMLTTHATGVTGAVDGDQAWIELRKPLR